MVLWAGCSGTDPQHQTADGCLLDRSAEKSSPLNKLPVSLTFSLKPAESRGQRSAVWLGLPTISQTKSWWIINPQQQKLCPPAAPQQTTFLWSLSRSGGSTGPTGRTRPASHTWISRSRLCRAWPRLCSTEAPPPLPSGVNWRERRRTI